MKGKKIFFSFNTFFHSIRGDIFFALLSVLLITSLTHNLNFMSYFAFAPFLMIIHRKNFRYALLFGAFIGLVVSLLSFDWAYNYVGGSLYVLVVIVTTLFFAAFAALTNFIYHKTKYMSLLAAPIMWVWLMLVLDFTKYGGYIFEISMYNPMTAPLIWLIGGRGITFMVIALNSAIAELFTKPSKKKILGVAIISAVLIFCYAYSGVAEARGDTFKVVLMQGNFNQSWGWRQDNVREIFANYQKMSYGQSGKDLIVWPEFAIPTDISFDPFISKGLQEIAKNNNAFFITGSLIFDVITKNHYDVALLFDKKGDVIDTFKSVKPAFYNRNTLKGEGVVKPFVLDNKKAGIMICAEEMDSKISRLQVKQGAQFLISISNDQNLGRGIHLAKLYPRLRAAENYKYLVRATNTGITQIVNPYGKTKEIEENERKILIGEILLNEHKTPYTIYGDIPLYSLTFLIILLIKKRRTR
ncbi:MAG: nitrilase-related carbon-nitrogen hydrolase [Nanoarchaeota archaeon]|nr:nitrilase-related carbon-nitrogen hydrolase [Nanoarchaeota archaeon]